MPRAEYSYDKAIQTIIELNEIYNPSYIYCDAGSGEYQIEKLHIYGDENPASGLKNKVKRWHLSQTIDVLDPITGELEKKPVKPFMVNQLTISFERDRIMLSPWDQVLSKQLTDYEVERITQSGQPVYTSKDEHFCDAIGLAHLAFVLEFKDITKTIKDLDVKSKIKISSVSISKKRAEQMYKSINTSYSSRGNRNGFQYDLDEQDKPTATRVSLRSLRRSRSSNAWGRRCSGGGARSMW